MAAKVIINFNFKIHISQLDLSLTMLLIYVPTTSPRIQYIFDLIFEKRFSIKYNITNSPEDFIGYEYEKINYSDKRLKDEFFIKAHGLLNEHNIKQLPILVSELYDTKIFFDNASGNLDFDIFSAAFYMITRYEEYLSFTPDKFGRFKATDSLAYKNNFLSIPIVDKWISIFKDRLQKKYSHLKCASSKFQAILTYDIDIAYKYKGRNLKRFIGAGFKDIIQLNLKNFTSRLQTLIITKKDPWDVYDYLEKTIIDNKIPAIFFFLVGDNSSKDRNIYYLNPLVKKLINAVKKFSDIGLHPSFTTTSDADKIENEKRRLEDISEMVITKSRQHYLRFQLPETYNALVESGIAEDYSMAFADVAGFRAGTCFPFNFYDLKNEKETNLLVYPCTFMDGNYIYSSKSKDNIETEINNLIDEIKKVNGTFISIWHNHTVSETREYNEWRKVHDAMIKKITSVT